MGKIYRALEKSEGNNQSNFEDVSIEEEPEISQNIKKKDDKDSPVENKKKSPPLKKEIRHKEKEDVSFSFDENLENRISSNLITVKKPHSIESEQFRLLKNVILFPESGKPHKTIMVTSADKGEGKSFVASNLAVSISLSLDDYVLLMDADLRNPCIHDFFGLNNKKGLSNYLAGKKELSELFVKPDFLEKLTILPGGPPPLNPSELISSEHMKNLIGEVKSRYDDRYVIIDSPPPYMTSEANALATYVDGVIIVVKQGFTRKDRLKDLIDIYGKEKIIGVVKNYSRGLWGTGFGHEKQPFYRKRKGGK
ncbi:MAG: exopolysaccharide biosynthesis protein [Deltaproteobacteria bacterium]|nr:MAG: exopolysaccharide biosynthesis protein [Deltaproteobacteria bacterium]